MRASDSLHLAAAAAERLEQQAITVVDLRLPRWTAAGRPVLVINHPPQFVRGVMRTRLPEQDGRRVRVMAAPFHGVQLEWMVCDRAANEVVHA